MLIGSYSTSLVVISLCVAILASYTALDLAGRIATAKGRAVYLWITGGAVAMGVGIWSMHFIGMLALRGVTYRSIGAAALLNRNLLIYGLGGVLVPFAGIKLIDLLLTGLGLV